MMRFSKCRSVPDPTPQARRRDDALVLWVGVASAIAMMAASLALTR